MELLCCEGGEQLKRAFLDPVFLNDNRVLHNLLKIEEHYTVSSKYMDFQTDIKPFMRKVVTQWMREVSPISVFFTFCPAYLCWDERISVGRSPPIIYIMLCLYYNYACV